MSLMSEKLKNIKSLLFEDYLKEVKEEDIFFSERLNEHLCVKNTARTMFFCFVSFIIGIVYLIFVSFEDTADIMKMVGSALLIACSPVTAWLFYREYSKKSRNHGLMKTLLYIYWITFSAAFVLFCFAETISGRVPYSLVLYYISAACIPIARINESIFFTALIFILGLCSAFFGLPWDMYFISVLPASAAFFWLSRAVSGCFISLWLGEYRLETAEQQRTKALHTDVLTGLLNKQGLSVSFNEMIERDGGAGKISVILIDIDNFREYNHMYGYDKSDKCLSSICNCIKIMTKPYTRLISRFGGDDFVIVLEDMSEIKTVGFAEQLRQGVERMAVPFGSGIVTVSIGISGIKMLTGEETYSELLNEADDQLFIAKANGKNCIGYKDRPFIHESRRSAVNN